MESLKRHLLCIDRTTGKILWNNAVGAVLPEDTYQGMFAEHGYASHTPTSDGERVYAFFGKSGVIAFDMEGKELWKQDVGDGLDSRRWGSSSSPILYKDLVIVTASAEKKSLVALNKLTGKIAWQQKADGFESVWGTPILVKIDETRTDLVIGVPFELWAFNPENGELQWYCPGLDTDTFCSSVVSDDAVVFAVEGRSGGSIAVRAGGKDDVSKSNVLWSGRDRSRIGTPVIYRDRLYYFNSGIANCIDAKTGKQVFAGRLRKDLSPEQSNDLPSAASGFEGEGRRRGGPGGGQDYSSPIIAGGLIYYSNRAGDVFVIQPGDELKQIAVNRVSDDRDEDFSSTPAVAEGQLYIRSSKRLYCVAN
jgi:outer membrane protein assembly factor BamB